MMRGVDAMGKQGTLWTCDSASDCDTTGVETECLTAKVSWENISAKASVCVPKEMCDVKVPDLSNVVGPIDPLPDVSLRCGADPIVLILVIVGVVLVLAGVGGCCFMGRRKSNNASMAYQTQA